MNPDIRTPFAFRQAVALCVLGIVFTTACSNPNQDAKESMLPHEMSIVADINGCRDDAIPVATAISENPAAIYISGDVAYPNGAPDSYDECFLPLYGKMLDRMTVTPGDREYASDPTATAFWSKLGSAAIGSRHQPWQVTSVGAWDIYMLNSNCDHIGKCDEDSRQYQWLDESLTNSPNECIAVFWHQPRFTSSAEYRGQTYMAPMYDLLHSAGADALFVGNTHHYEHIDRIGPDGVATPTGIHNFTVGTGGAHLGGFGAPFDGSISRIANTPGYLQFTLSSKRFDWKFIDVITNTVLDAGSDSCV